MTESGTFDAHKIPAPLRRRHADHGRRQPLAGPTSPNYWAFVSPFGGITAATILRALVEHPQRAGEPLSLTVNYCAPIAEGDFDLDLRLVKANRSTQHWCVELSQGGAEPATLAIAVFAERRPSWSQQQLRMPEVKPFEELRPYPNVAASCGQAV